MLVLSSDDRYGSAPDDETLVSCLPYIRLPSWRPFYLIDAFTLAPNPWVALPQLPSLFFRSNFVYL